MGMRPSLLNSVAWASKLKAQAINTSKLASPHSRAASTRSGRVTVPNSGPMKIPAPFGLAFEVATFRANVIAGPGSERRKRDLVFLVSLLNSGALQIFQDHLRKTLLCA